MQLVCRATIVAALAVAFTAICLLAPLAQCAEVAQLAQPTNTAEAQLSPFQLPKLFDFEYYKVRFGKEYASIQENLARKAYFVARALRAFVSGVNFKWRRSNYFLAINHMSDSSPQEKDQRRNRVQARASMEAQESSNVLQDDEIIVADQADAPNEMHEFLVSDASDDEDVREQLVKLAEAHADEPGYHELFEAAMSINSRRKRSVEQAQEPRSFSLDELIKPGVHEPTSESPEVLAKLVDDDADAHDADDADEVESQNPNNKRRKALNQGLNARHKDVKLWAVPANGGGLQAKSSQFDLSKWMSFTKTKKNDEPNEETHDDDDDAQDVMYVDHRDSNCFLAPRAQGNCGSCYGFAAIAYMEWLYCVKKGKIVRFSEQYMVDCGKDRYKDNLDGCEGATDYSVVKFIQNFGMERAKHYPYRAREGICPYDDKLNLEQTGYIRMELDNFVKVPVSRWNEYLKYGPMYMTIASPADYDEYSGGVHDGRNCDKWGDHAQLLVGHGREDGKDFWLIRNSYGASWGEGGYFKLSKDAPKRCIDDQIGYVLGSIDAVKYTVAPGKNPKNKKIK